MDNFPNELQIYALVVVDDSVTQSIEMSPGNRRVRIHKRLVNLVCQLTHLTEIEYAGFHQLGIIAKLRITDADTVTQNLIRVSNELPHNDVISHRRSPRCFVSPGQ